METAKKKNFVRGNREEQKMRIWKYEAAAADAGKPLEKILREAGFTRKEISRQKFLPMGITVDGEKSRVNRIIFPGEEICLQLETVMAADSETCQNSCGLSDHEDYTERLKICMEDEDILIVNKPSGLSCHPCRGHYQDNLGSLAAAYCGEKGEPLTVRTVGRLDKETSGLVVFAKNQTAAARLWKQKEKQLFQKTYFACVHGVPEKTRDRIELPIGPVQGEKNRMQICREGKSAVTDYQVLRTGTWNGGSISLLKCQILTGRTHQIRVHMAALGHPILGDDFYGKPDGAARLCLHAGEIDFFHPFTGEKIHICALPDLLETFVGYEEIKRYQSRGGEGL